MINNLVLPRVILSAFKNLLHAKESEREFFAAIRKETGLFCGSFIRKGDVLAYVGLFQNQNDLTARNPDVDNFVLGRLLKGIGFCLPKRWSPWHVSLANSPKIRLCGRGFGGTQNQGFMRCLKSSLELWGYGAW